MPFATGSVAIDSGTVLVLITLLVTPIAAIAFARSGAAWSSIGKGPLGLDHESPPPRPRGGPPPPVDTATQAAEVRQMLEAKAARQARHGEAPVDVEAEVRRLLAAAERPDAEEAMAAELRAEVRQLVIARNERRRRQGLEPLDVAAETDRQLADLVGSQP
ncbi:MAG TPA: hypothetical protein VGO24_05460 [Solirubrobacterales bacterium]|jgi:hypothetical protein|nr:hypothetical protein [Solirubrobacterales bacterium]